MKNLKELKKFRNKLINIPGCTSNDLEDFDKIIEKLEDSLRKKKKSKFKKLAKSAFETGIRIFLEVMKNSP